MSLLKKKIGTKKVPSTVLPTVGPEGQFLVHPVVVLSRRLVKKENRLVPQMLEQWFNTILEDATWEDSASIHVQFPDFNPRGQGFQKGEARLF